MTDMLHQVDALLDAREIKKAEVLVAKPLRANPPPELRAQLLLRRARARLIGQHPDDALEDILTAKALSPDIEDDPQVNELLGDTYFERYELAPVGFAERGDAEQAIALYQSIIDKNPGYRNIGWVYYQKGRVLLAADQSEAAITCFQEALLRPSQVNTLTAFCYERLGFVYLFERRDPTTALSFLERAAVTYPPSEPESWLGQLHILRSRALREQGDFPEALKAAERALQIMEKIGAEMRGGQQDAHLALGEILARIPDHEARAANHLQQFLQLGKKPLGVDVTWSRVNELLGEMFFQTGRFEAAIEAYNNSLIFNPYHPWQTSIYHQIARCYYRLRMYEKVIATIRQMERAIEEESRKLEDYRVFHLLGNAHFVLEEYAEAVAAYRQAVVLAPENAEDLDKIQTYLRFAEELSAQ